MVYPHSPQKKYKGLLRFSPPDLSGCCFQTCLLCSKAFLNFSVQWYVFLLLWRFQPACFYISYSRISLAFLGFNLLNTKYSRNKNHNSGQFQDHNDPMPHSSPPLVDRVDNIFHVKEKGVVELSPIMLESSNTRKPKMFSRFLAVP